MNHLKKSLICMFGAGLFAIQAHAQLSSNPDKFLGNITTRYQMDAGGGVQKYYELWNQVTPENESKWGSVEGTKGSFNWGCDTPFNYAKQHGFTYKFHALVWGAQYPNWFSTSMSIKDRYNAIVNWYNKVKTKYKTLPMIDVVNEAVGNHQAGNSMMKESLGGGGKTGYDWLIKAFELAYERWPDAILIYNDYNTFQWDTDNYIDLVRTLRDAGAPIDAYGCQSHDLTDCDVNKFKTADKKIQDALKMPMYSTEYDIGTSDDALQLKRYKEQIPYMWENDYCAGITLWGYIYGATWTTDGNSGIIKNGKDRPAMTWLREYMASEAAQNAKSPFPGMKKEASIYIKPAALKVARGDKLPIKVRASMATKTIQKIDLYVGEKENSMELMTTLTEDPYLTEYAVPSDAKTGWKFLKAVVTTTDGSTYERYSRFNILSSTESRAPYNETVPSLPGTININEYDKGASGVSYSNPCYDYKTRATASATKDNSWMEYTVDVEEEGNYSFDVELASTKSGGVFHLAEYGLDNLTYLTDFIEVPKTGSTTDFQIMTCTMKEPLTAGRHTFCLNIDKGGFYIKNIKFYRFEEDKNITVTVKTFRPTTIELGDKVEINVTVKSSSEIANVKLYANNLFVGTMTETAEENTYSFEFEPTEKGSYSIQAIATSVDGKGKISTAKTLKVNGKRSPYKSIIEIPGVIQAENFDKGGEGLTFHDSDSNREGDTNYRTDGEGVDFVKGNGGTCIGYTAKDEWLEYTIDVTEAGKYEYIATVSSGTTGSGFKIGLVKNGKVSTTLATINVPQTGNNDWGTYTTVEGEFSKELEAGEQILRFTITGNSCNIDKVELKCTTAGIHDMIYDVPLSQDAYDLFGRKVNSNYKGIIIQNGKKRINR